MNQNAPIAIILAAGIGRRLKPVTNGIPKCLLPFGGKTLLARNLEALKLAGIKQVCLVVGHLSELVRTEVNVCNPGISIKIVENPRYEQGSAISLLCAEETFNNSEILIIDADVLYDKYLLRQLSHHLGQNTLFIDKQFQDTGEEVKAFVKGQYVYALGKAASSCCGDLAGESLGLYKFSNAACQAIGESLRRTITQHGSYVEYEEAINNILHKFPMHYIEVFGRPWIEIDFPHDLERAQNVIFPLLNQIDKNK